LAELNAVFAMLGRFNSYRKFDLRSKEKLSELLQKEYGLVCPS